MAVCPVEKRREEIRDLNDGAFYDNVRKKIT